MTEVVGKLVIGLKQQCARCSELVADLKRCKTVGDLVEKGDIIDKRLKESDRLDKILGELSDEEINFYSTQATGIGYEGLDNLQDINKVRKLQWAFHPNYPLVDAMEIIDITEGMFLSIPLKEMLKEADNLRLRFNREEMRNEMIRLMQKQVDSEEEERRAS